MSCPAAPISRQHFQPRQQLSHCPLKCPRHRDDHERPCKYIRCLEKYLRAVERIAYRMERLTYDLGCHAALPAHSERQRQRTSKTWTQLWYIDISDSRPVRHMQYPCHLQQLDIYGTQSAHGIQIQYRRYDQQTDEKREILIARPYQQQYHEADHGRGLEHSDKGCEKCSDRAHSVPQHRRRYPDCCTRCKARSDAKQCRDDRDIKLRCAQQAYQRPHRRRRTCKKYLITNQAIQPVPQHEPDRRNEDISPSYIPHEQISAQSVCLLFCEIEVISRKRTTHRRGILIIEHLEISRKHRLHLFSVDADDIAQRDRLLGYGLRRYDLL